MDTTWQKIEKVWTSDTTGLEMLRFNIYVGSDTGTLYFDDLMLTAESAPTGMRNPKLSGGIPIKNVMAFPGVDAAGRSIKIGKTGARSGIAITPYPNQ